MFSKEFSSSYFFVMMFSLFSKCILIAVFGESGRESVVGLGSPYFQHQEAGIVNVTTQLEATTYLHCRVNRLGGKTVRTCLTYSHFDS